MKLAAYHQEGNIYIEVIVDGRGIDRAKIREKSESTGLVRQGEEISDALLLSFLLIPGFLTPEKVGDLSVAQIIIAAVKEARGRSAVIKMKTVSETVKTQMKICGILR